MEKKFANLLAKKIVALIPTEDKNWAVLAYGFELLFTSLLGVLLLIVSSFFAATPCAWIPFLLGFAPLRTTAGGYHASTHLKCYFITTTTFSCCVSIAKSQLLSTFHMLVLAIATVHIVVFFAPVAANNKPLSEERQVRNRERSITISLVMVLFSVILCLTRFSNIYTTLLFMGSSAASLSLIVATIINLFRKGGNYNGSN